MSHFNRREGRNRIHRRIRKKLRGTTERPRLAVYFSGRNVYAQVIDDLSGRTLAAASTQDKTIKARSANVANATKVGELIASRAKSANISSVVFDRGGHLYHGKVKALADAARSGGLDF